MNCELRLFIEVRNELNILTIICFTISYTLYHCSVPLYHLFHESGFQILGRDLKKLFESYSTIRSYDKYIQGTESVQFDSCIISLIILNSYRKAPAFE